MMFGIGLMNVDIEILKIKKELDSIEDEISSKQELEIKNKNLIPIINPDPFMESPGILDLIFIEWFRNKYKMKKCK